MASKDDAFKAADLAKFGLLMLQLQKDMKGKEALEAGITAILDTEFSPGFIDRITRSDPAVQNAFQTLQKIKRDTTWGRK